MDKQMQINEAIERMKILKLHKNVINEFKEGTLNMSENGGFLYWIEDEMLTKIRDVEGRYNIVVYHAIHDYTDFGEILTLMYVSDDEEEWEMDRDDLTNGYPCAYVINLDDDYCSEFGSVQVVPQIGGLKRIA